MALPAAPFEFTRVMDPKDRVPRLIKISGPNSAVSAGTFPMLGPDEEMVGHTLELLAESTALGLRILTEAPWAPVVTTDTILIFLEVAEPFQHHTAFDGQGSRLGMELTFTTNNEQSKQYQRTIVQRVAQQ